MKFKTNEKIKWTSLELEGLLEDDDSCVHYTRTLKHLALHPFHLKDLRKSLNEILISKLNTYDVELKGFLISYRNSKLLSNLGEIFYDSCFIHVDIEADFYLFCPKVGCSLKGIVNKKGLDHIVVLVHKIFTVTIPKPDNMEEKWLGDTVEIGQEVKCCVTQIDRSTKLPSICATLNTDYSQGCKLSETFNNITDTNTNIENNIKNIKAMANGSNVTGLEDDATFNEETLVMIKIEADSEDCNNTSLSENTDPIKKESRKRKKRNCSETEATLEPERKRSKSKKDSKNSIIKKDLSNTKAMTNELNVTLFENDITFNEETPVRIKTEVLSPDEYNDTNSYKYPNEYNNTNSNEYSDQYNNINSSEYIGHIQKESRKKKKRERFESDVSEPEKKTNKSNKDSIIKKDIDHTKAMANRSDASEENVTFNEETFVKIKIEDQDDYNMNSNECKDHIKKESRKKKKRERRIRAEEETE